MAIPIQNQQLQSLQIGRAVAALTVLYFHTGHTPIFGSFGVDIFFVISGFVMGMIADTQQNTKIFLVNRISRIVPLYWLFTIIIFIFSAMYPELMGSTKPIFSNLLKSLFFIPFYKESGGIQPVLFVGWSLNYEMLFYGLVAIAMITTKSFQKFLGFITFLFILIYLIFGHLIHSRLLNEYFGRDIIFEFILGIFIYYLYKNNKLNSLPKVYFIIFGCASYVFMAIAATSHLQLKQIYIFGIPSFIFVLSLVNLENQIHYLPTYVSKFLAAMGDASYSIYLVHYFIISLFQRVITSKLHIFYSGSFIEFIAMVVITLVLGYVIFIFIDKPLHKRVKNYLSSNLY